MSDIKIKNDIETLSPGKTLRAAREKAGQSQREVGNAIHLLPRQIDALENDRYHEFNGDIFCRGYIKSYAKLFAINPAQLITDYQAICPASQEKVIFAPPVVAHIQNPSKGKNIYFWGVAATVLVAGVLWLYGEGREASFTSNIIAPTAAVIVDKNRPVSELVESNSTAFNNLSENQSNLVDIALVEMGASNLLDEGQFAETLSIGEASREGSSSLQSEAVGVDSWLVFDFNEDCWIEVKDRDNQVIYTALKRANQTLKLSGKAPFKVLLGYAHGVSVNFNGEPVVFDVNQRTNAARLVIGQL